MEWTPEARAGYMKKTLEIIKIGGIWGMTMGIWKRTGETTVELTPFVSDAEPDAINQCNHYAEDARRAGFTVTVKEAEKA